jgi:hypothetical protein
MAENPKASTRLRPIIHAYLADLAKLGTYGKNKAGVMRRFIENGIVAALEGGVLEKKDVRDHGEQLEDGEEDES